jgi:hypothetical protein
MKVLEMNIMDMNELEIKSILHGIIQKARNKRKLLRYFDAFKEVEVEDKTDFWAEYTPEQRADIEFAIEESFNPENWVSHEEVMAKYSKYSKNDRKRNLDKIGAKGF